MDGTRRSSRLSGEKSSKEESIEPVTTASGRQVKPRAGGIYGESMLSGQVRKNGSPAITIPNGADPHEQGVEEDEEQEISSGRPSRSRRPHHAPKGWSTGGQHIAGYNEVDEMDDEEDAASSNGSDEYDAGEDNADDDDDKDDYADDESPEDEMSPEDDDLDSDDDKPPPKKRKTKVVRLKLRKPARATPQKTTTQAPAMAPAVKVEHEVNGNGTVAPHPLTNGTTTAKSALGVVENGASVGKVNGVEGTSA